MSTGRRYTREERHAMHARELSRRRALLVFLRRHEALVPAWMLLAGIAKAEGVIPATRKRCNISVLLASTWRKRGYYESAEADHFYRLSTQRILPMP